MRPAQQRLGHHGPMSASSVLRPLPACGFADWLDGAITRLADYLQASGRATPAEALEQARRTHAELLPQGLQTPGHHLFEVHDARGHPVGQLWLQLGAGGRAHLYDLFIEPQHRRQGHARRAMQALLAEAAQLGAQRLGLNVLAANEAARQLYEQLGFQVHSLQMSRPLPQPAS